eukprot:3066061-Rhodomonas_salina.1
MRKAKCRCRVREPPNLRMLWSGNGHAELPRNSKHSFLENVHCVRTQPASSNRSITPAGHFIS